jgi:carboxylesterase
MHLRMIPDLFTPEARPFRLDGTNGEAVVAVHGFTGIPGHFTPLAGFLNEHGYTVNVPLVSGHGVDPEHLADADRAGWLESVLHAVNAVADHRRVHLVGLSLGGLLSILAAPRTAAATITTINSPILVRDKRLYLAPMVHRVVPPMDWSDQPTPQLDDEVAHLWQTLPGYHASSAAELTKTIVVAYRTARRLRRPSLVIQSRTDESVDPRSGSILANALGPDCRTVWLDRSIHNALLGEARDTVASSVLERIS